MIPIQKREREIHLEACHFFSSTFAGAAAGTPGVGSFKFVFGAAPSPPSLPWDGSEGSVLTSTAAETVTLNKTPKVSK